MGNCWPLAQTKPHQKTRMELELMWRRRWSGVGHRRKERKDRKQLSVAGGRRGRRGSEREEGVRTREESGAE